MLYIVVGIIILFVLYSFFSWLSDMVGGSKILLIIIVVLLVAFLAFSWMGVFGIILACVAVALLAKAGNYIGSTLKQHDKEMKETEQIRQATQEEKQKHDNDKALLDELNRKCFHLGCMDEEKWKRALPNYVNRSYTTSFEEITKNFAEQIERNHIVNNDKWFDIYVKYILKHPGGSTIAKMIEEVDCIDLKMTHITPDKELLERRMQKGTERISGDIPPWFYKTSTEEGEIYTPTPYLKKLHGVDENLSSDSIHTTDEINFDEL